MTGRRSPARANLRMLLVLQAFRGAAFFVPVWAFFLREHGLTFTQFFLLQTIFAGTVAVFQIPTGAFSDVVGRKTTLLIASLCDLAGTLTYAMSSSFVGFAVGNVLIAAGLSFAAGTIEAMAYESVAEAEGSLHGFRTYFGKLSFARFASEAVASLAATLLLTIGTRATFWATAGSSVVSIACVFLLSEPHRHRIEGVRHWTTVRHAIGDVLKVRALRGVILLDVLLTALCLMLYWFSQPYQTMVGFPLALFGVLHAAIVLAGAFASRFGHTLERTFSDRAVFLGLAAIITGSYVALGWTASIIALPLLFAVRMCWSALRPLTVDIVSRLSRPSARATTLSVGGLAFQTFYGTLQPFVGSATDAYGLPTVLLWIGSVGAFAATGAFLVMGNAWKTIPPLRKEEEIALPEPPGAIA